MTTNKYRKAHPEWFDEKGRPHVWVLRELIDYDPATGRMVWKARGEKWCHSRATSTTWNKRFVGKSIGAIFGTDFRTRIFGRDLAVLKICCAITDGVYPDGCVHIGEITDMRRSNIVTSDRGGALTSLSFSTEGWIGYDKKQKVFRPTIASGRNRKTFLGSWVDRADAEAALAWGRHEFLTGASGSECPDVPDGWNFRRAQALNKQKLAKRRGKSSGFTGVVFCKAHGKTRAAYWAGRLYVGARVFQKSANTEIEAARAYNELAIKHLGKKAILNIIPNAQRPAPEKIGKPKVVSRRKKKFDDI